MFKLVSSPHLAQYECDNCGYQINGHPKSPDNKIDKCPGCNKPVKEDKIAEYIKSWSKL
jgi:rubrerythrin